MDKHNIYIYIYCSSLHWQQPKPSWGPLIPFLQISSNTTPSQGPLSFSMAATRCKSNGRLLQATQALWPSWATKFSLQSRGSQLVAIGQHAVSLSSSSGLSKMVKKWHQKHTPKKLSFSLCLFWRIIFQGSCEFWTCLLSGTSPQAKEVESTGLYFSKEQVDTGMLSGGELLVRALRNWLGHLLSQHSSSTQKHAKRSRWSLIAGTIAVGSFCRLVDEESRLRHAGYIFHASRRYAKRWYPFLWLTHRPSELQSVPTLHGLLLKDDLWLQVLQALCDILNIGEWMSFVTNQIGFYNLPLQMHSVMFWGVISGLRQLIVGLLIHAQCILIQLRRSKAPERAYVSEANVLATTRLIFLENHTKGLTLEVLVWSISSVVAKIKQPFCECAFSRVANAASENDRKRILSGDRDWILMETSENLFGICQKFIPMHQVSYSGTGDLGL